MAIKTILSFSLCSVAAIDRSMTNLAYSESVNRDGISAEQIGIAVIKAISKLESPDDVGQVIIRFSDDT